MGSHPDPGLPLHTQHRDPTGSKTHPPTQKKTLRVASRAWILKAVGSVMRGV